MRRKPTGDVAHLIDQVSTKLASSLLEYHFLAVSYPSVKTFKRLEALERRRKYIEPQLEEVPFHFKDIFRLGANSVNAKNTEGSFSASRPPKSPECHISFLEIGRKTRPIVGNILESL